MKQLIQNFKTGDLYVDEVPMPALSQGKVLIENRYSLISAGTERGTVQVAKANLVGKAKQRPDLVAQVIQNVRKEGLKATLDKVQTKLDSWKALGYSTAGVVKASMDGQGLFKPGDRVACAGQDYASHAEMVAVPQNLVVKIPDEVTFAEASFTTLGAIAMQGVRQAEPRLGENVCVIGLGLLGQLTCQLLKANGCNVFGVDLADNLVELAAELSAHRSMNRQDSQLLKALENFTHGHGFDSVIITAAAPSNDPIELAAEIARKKGKVVVVGAVKMDIPRDPHFYRKELDLRMSCSYGPGRYDVQYEEQGQDYPYAYVRWSEQRNMEAFLKLIANKSLNLKPLITHQFEIQHAEKAYELVLGKVQEPYIGILLHYPENQYKYQPVVEVSHNPVQTLNAGFIGAGSFAQSYLIPNLKKAGISLDTVVTSKGITAKNVAQKFGFNHASTQAAEVLENKTINIVCIATPHNSHAAYTVEALKAGKHVFVEKPLAMNTDELQLVRQAYEQADSKLMVGFNRRFAPVSLALKKEFEGIGEPLMMNFRVNAGFIPKDHWTQLEAVGGGRIIGEVCHFVDLMQFFTNSLPVKVYADCIDATSAELKNDDNITIIIKFADGSVGNLIYTANGDKSLPKERLEIHGGGKVGVIDNFREGALYKNNKMQKLRLSGKGHKQELERFTACLQSGQAAPIAFESLYYTTLTTFKIVESLQTALPQQVSE